MSSRAAAVPAARTIINLGMDVHKDAITIAVLPGATKAPTRLERLPNELPKLKKWMDRVARDGEIHACYAASGAGYGRQRALREWGYACEVIAPSLIPRRAGVHRQHDTRDAADLARLYRAGELVPVRIPSEADERVRDVVRCRDTFQREILKSRHYILKCLATRGFVFREGTNWCTPHLQWLQHLTTDNSPLAAEDRLVYREYHALLLYKLQRREELDRQIAQLAELPTLKPMVERLQCVRGISLHSAMVLASNGPASSRAIWALSHAKTQAAIGNASARSRRRATVSDGTCASRRRGAIGIGRKSASTASAGRRANRRL